ncbi:basic salivary proline-rich protein 1-like [Cynocephalus volans]|uniref:basic salivary proline-rich protein 1-like n=1 Tax=Cynocephalus volans TaxID=110931 RepID=UPI002FCBA0C3
MLGVPVPSARPGERAAAAAAAAPPRLPPGPPRPGCGRQRGPRLPDTPTHTPAGGGPAPAPGSPPPPPGARRPDWTPPGPPLPLGSPLARSRSPGLRPSVCPPLAISLAPPPPVSPLPALAATALQRGTSTPQPSLPEPAVPKLTYGQGGGAGFLPSPPPVLGLPAGRTKVTRGRKDSGGVPFAGAGTSRGGSVCTGVWVLSSAPASAASPASGLPVPPPGQCVGGGPSHPEFVHPRQRRVAAGALSLPEGPAPTPSATLPHRTLPRPRPAQSRR